MASKLLLPNFLFIGPDKAGSTWLYHCLKAHPSVFVPNSKELFFFDQYFDLGVDWYSKQYRNAMPEHVVRADISHNYLFSEAACQRIRDILPHAKLMVTLREPTERAFSAYLYMLRQGRLTSCSFEDALARIPELTNHGMYYQHLRPFLDSFPPAQLYISIFDDLVEDSANYFAVLCDFLNIDAEMINADLTQPVLRAARSRAPALTATLRMLANGLRSIGAPGIIGRIKDSKVFHTLMYAEFQEGHKPTASATTLRRLREEFLPDLQSLDESTGTTLISRWKYDRCNP